MYEFEVELKTGEIRFLFGYSYTDALKREHLIEKDIRRLLYKEYID